MSAASIVDDASSIGNGHARVLRPSEPRSPSRDELAAGRGPAPEQAGARAGRRDAQRVAQWQPTASGAQPQADHDLGRRRNLGIQTRFDRPRARFEFQRHVGKALAIGEDERRGPRAATRPLGLSQRRVVDLRRDPEPGAPRRGPGSPGRTRPPAQCAVETRERFDHPGHRCRASQFHRLAGGGRRARRSRCVAAAQQRHLRFGERAIALARAYLDARRSWPGR